jgi:MFS superfamily sulfate permease-like transporter
MRDTDMQGVCDDDSSSRSSSSGALLGRTPTHDANQLGATKTRPRAAHQAHLETKAPSARHNLQDVQDTRLTWHEIQSEMLSGTVVSLALIPESVAFSIVAGVSPIKSLVTTSVMLLASASLGGRPGMISGAAGALAVVSRDIVREYGEAYLFLAVGLCGLLQVLLSALKVDGVLRMLPTSVISGFMCGLAVIISKSQIHYFYDQDGLKADWPLMVFLSSLGLAVLRISERFPTSVPASLLAIVLLTVVVEITGLQTLVSFKCCATDLAHVYATNRKLIQPTYANM